MTGPRTKPCIFCASPTAMTKEHVIPQWVEPHMVGDGVFTATRNTPDGRSSSHTTTRLPWVVKRVCATCNSGWMSSLENAAKPYVEPMILGTQTTLHPAAQRIVVRWALKTATMFLCMDRQIGPPEQATRHVQALGGEPPNAAVWLSKYEDDAHPWSSWASATGTEMRLNSRPGKMWMGRSVAFTVRHLALLAFMPPTEFSNRALDTEPPREKKPWLQRLGGTQPVEWPPAGTLKSQDLATWAKPFGDRDDSDARPNT
jgi:hypothetical protein